MRSTKRKTIVKPFLRFLGVLALLGLAAGCSKALSPVVPQGLPGGASATPGATPSELG